MSFRYELPRLFLRLAVAVAAALVLAALWALAHGGGFRHSLEVGCYVIGSLAFLLAAVGGSPSRRDASSAGWMEQWAYKNTFRANRANPPDRALGPMALLLVVGMVLVMLGWAIS
jgi:hypothetical protein